MLINVSFFEGQFSPAEAAVCTGLPLTLQRDWRALGLLASNEGGHARFKPHELAAMKIMVRLRRHGLKPAESHAVAVRYAPTLLYHCLDEPMGLALDDSSERGKRYLQKLGLHTDEGFRTELVEADPDTIGHYLWLPEDGLPEVIADLDRLRYSSQLEEVTYLSFIAMAAKLLEKIPRPLFTLKVPKTFQ